ncbi:hypothetical protein BC008_36905 [Mastigocoleus testarum BC008]|uniref:Uncharacterized protein n=1 Tax=Mastigocoleus testarum BC008 TaxID=371196 RepID=A0A0V8A0E0_9CYAN|nr:hypothetical protein BC008_27300 [Mastigocoleus testarum BC008]KST70234.1 hypothetical protein BC008_36905 [Mastigocoleus testarum BC008]
MHNAISPLLEKDVYKLYLLIEALKRIDKNESSRGTTKILNDVEKYLKQSLNSLNTDDLESLQEESGELLQKFYRWLIQGFEIHTEINYLSPNRKKELIALGYFLQGELSTQEEFSYIKKVLRSYLAIIERFRNPSSTQ